MSLARRAGLCLCAALVALGLLVGCGSERADALLLGTGARVAVPAFTVRLVLTPAAQQRLEAVGERIVVSVWFDGDGRPLAGVNMKAYRDVYLGSAEREIRTAETDVLFAGETVAADDVARLSGSYVANINVFSARRVMADNVLDCGARFVPIAEAAAAPVSIRCDALLR